MLKNSKDTFISGQLISQKLEVTRTTVWKYVKDLKDEGYNIQSSSKKGYMLLQTQDILNSYEIGHNLHTKHLGKEIYYLKTVDSTNSYSKKIAIDGCKDGTLVVAGAQTSGRGRMGRTWESKDNKGIWMSLILKPEILPSRVQIITLAASIAVVEGIRGATGIKTGIKWPNDIIANGKKICGILTEMNSELDRVNYIILGIGININHDVKDFEPELKDRATSLKMLKHSQDRCNKEIIRSNIIKEILQEFERLYKNIKDGETDIVLKEWKEASITLGREIKIVLENNEYIGTALDVTSDGKLVVEDLNGVVHELISGEVSIRGMSGYSK